MIVILEMFRDANFVPAAVGGASAILAGVAGLIWYEKSKPALLAEEAEVE